MNWPKSDMRSGIGALFLLFAVTGSAGVATLAGAASVGNDVPLIEAARNGSVDRALDLIAEGADVNARASDDTTALHWAVQNNDVKLVKRLIAEGADVEAINDYNTTPLLEAAVVGNVEVIDALLDGGARPDTPSREGQTALMVVARSSNVDAAARLLEAGADPNAREDWRGQTAIMWAAAQCQPEMVKLLLEHGAKPNVRAEVNDWKRQITAETRRMWRPKGGLTPLLYAARDGCVECARHLVEGGADIDLPNPRGVTPLFIAVNNFHFDTGKYLLEAGANPNKWDWWGRTPLYAAVDLNTVPHGGWPDRPSDDDTTSLEMIELLLEHGANPDVRLKKFPPYRSIVDDRGCDDILTIGATPLLRAAKGLDAPAIDILLDYNPRVNLPNTDGVTPVMAAAGLGSLECDSRGQYETPDAEERSIASLRQLLDAGGDINAKVTGGEGRFSHLGQTALHGAAFWGWNKVVKFLVEHGADIDAEDASGRTPVDAAMGRAGGHGRGNRTEVYKDTAQLLRKLCEQQRDCTLPSAASKPQP